MADGDRELSELREQLESLYESMDHLETQMASVQDEIARLQAAYHEAKDEDSFFDDVTGEVFGNDEDQIEGEVHRLQRQLAGLQQQHAELGNDAQELTEEIEAIVEQQEIHDQVVRDIDDVDVAQEPSAVEIAALIGDDAMATPDERTTELDRDLPLLDATGGVDAGQGPPTMAEVDALSVDGEPGDLDFGAGVVAAPFAAAAPTAEPSTSGADAEPTMFGAGALDDLQVTDATAPGEGAPADLVGEPAGDAGFAAFTDPGDGDEDVDLGLVTSSVHEAGLLDEVAIAGGGGDDPDEP